MLKNIQDLIKKTKKDEDVESSGLEKKPSVVSEKSFPNESKSVRDEFLNLMKDLDIDIRYYFLKEGFQDQFFELYKENFKYLEEFGFTPKRLFDYIRESFDRFKQIQKKMPLEPMSQKAFDYIEKSVNELFANMVINLKNRDRNRL